MDTETESVSIPGSGGQTMSGYLARPTEGGVRPGVVVFMEAFGLNGHIRDVVERIAAEGYVAVAPDFFHRTAPGLDLPYDTEISELMKVLGQLHADQMLEDVRATLAFLRARSDVRGDRLGCIGSVSEATWRT